MNTISSEEKEREKKEQEVDNIVPFNTEYVFKPHGLRNTGVICYLNSFIQALMSCTSITQFFLEQEERFLSENNTVAIEYVNLIKQANENNNPVLNPSRLFKAIIKEIRKKYPNKRFGRGQEDSGEGLHLFLDVINDDSLYKLFIHKYVFNIWCLECGKMLKKGTDSSVITEVFKKYRPIKSNGVSNKHPLNNHIFQYASPHPDYKCGHCGQTKCCSTYQLSSTPEIFTIMFHKFQKKSIMDFPEFMYFPTKIGFIKYRIIAKIEHAGSMGGGHYWTHALRKTDTDGLRMFILNDTSHTELGNTTPTNETYIIFYHYLEEVTVKEDSELI